MNSMFADIAATQQQGSGDIVAIAGIIGTLAGAALGAYSAWKIQKSQLEHEDRVRFHDKRVAVYAEFSEAVETAVVKLSQGNVCVEELKKIVRTSTIIRFISSLKVVELVDPVTRPFTPRLSGQVLSAEEVAAIHAHLATLTMAMRKEIEVDSVNK